MAQRKEITYHIANVGGKELYYPSKCCGLKVIMPHICSGCLKECALDRNLTRLQRV